MKPTLGCVPFLNAKPLVAKFLLRDEHAADVVFEQPAILGPMVSRGEVDAAIASSFFVVQDPTLRIASGVSISSRNAVESVRLFSKVPFSEITSLALDNASMTSNHLAQIILAEIYDNRPACSAQNADLTTMLSEFDAAVLIGDAGMTADAENLHVLDLGSAWKTLTGKPFVWALWVGKAALDEELAASLLRAKEYGLQELPAIASRAAQEMPITYEIALDYLSRVIDYDLNDDHLAGFEEFGKKCVQMGFVKSFSMPRVVGEAPEKARTS
jgi:chorismate dehydratase